MCFTKVAIAITGAGSGIGVQESGRRNAGACKRRVSALCKDAVAWGPGKWDAQPRVSETQGEFVV